MPNITFSNKKYHCSDSSTLLDSLLKQGANLPFSCKGGGCHSCLIKATKGRPTTLSQSGLKDTLVVQNYFLPCICKPTEDMELVLNSQSPTFDTTLLKKEWLNGEVVLLRLARPDNFTYSAGQFISIAHPSLPVNRSYSLASLNHENFLELHVKHIPNGVMSTYLCSQLQEGGQVTLTSAMGDCFYLNDDSDAALLLAGSGTGLAPLYGIVRDALQSGHAGDIHLFQAALHADSLYHSQHIQVLTQQYPQLKYTACVLHGDPPEGGRKGSIETIITRKLPEKLKAYLCGDEQVVTAMKVALISNGISMTNIYADAFTITQ